MISSNSFQRYNTQKQNILIIDEIDISANTIEEAIESFNIDIKYLHHYDGSIVGAAIQGDLEPNTVAYFDYDDKYYIILTKLTYDNCSAINTSLKHISSGKFDNDLLICIDVSSLLKNQMKRSMINMIKQELSQFKSIDDLAEYLYNNYYC